MSASLGMSNELVTKPTSEMSSSPLGSVTYKLRFTTSSSLTDIIESDGTTCTSGGRSISVALMMTVPLVSSLFG
ncbi:hypothetical protein E1140_01630 [Fulvivirga lutimaris]|nr:hypothetical protein [Fulvivirga lutimaris]